MKKAFTTAGAGRGASLTGLRACGHAAFTMADRLSRPTESGAIHLDPSVWTTNNVTEGITSQCHREERANASDVAIHRRTWRFNGIATHPADARNDGCGQAAFTMAGAGQRAPLIGLRTCGHAAFTLADRLSRLHNGLVGSRLAFTMAEILLSLTIIGVVAAITLPSLTGNINERTWNTQRKALYARFSQAIALMPSLNGYGTLTTNASGSVTADTAAETFVTDGLSKVLKINNICDNAHLADCGISNSYTDMLGSRVSFPTTLYQLNDYFRSAAYYSGSFSTVDTKAAAFETQNGESIAVYYNPSCKAEYINDATTNIYGEAFGFPQLTMCANFVYDLNGNKGPNTVGKDIGYITAFNSIDSEVVAPMPSSTNIANGGNTVASWDVAAKACTEDDVESRLPNIQELQAMMINRNFINLTPRFYWSGTVGSSTNAWDIEVQYGGVRILIPKSHDNVYVRCIKR